MGAIIEGLNVAYDVKETRAWWRRTLLAILLTIALAVLIITALALVFTAAGLLKRSRTTTVSAQRLQQFGGSCDGCS